MYNISLTKADKRLCRELIHVGSERECKHYVEQMKRLTEKPMPLSELNAPYREENGWSVEGPWHKRYIQLFKATEKFDKHIARRYDGISGGSYINCVIDYTVTTGLAMRTSAVSVRMCGRRSFSLPIEKYYSVHIQSQ